MSPRTPDLPPGRVAVLLVTVAAAAACTAGGPADGGPGEAAAPTPTIEQEVELGGLNLEDYCHFIGYDRNTDRSCYSPIPSPADIPDKTAYCTKAVKTARATRLDDTWVCEIPLNPDKACDWQYGGHDLKARKADNAWICTQ